MQKRLFVAFLLTRFCIASSTFSLHPENLFAQYNWQKYAGNPVLRADEQQGVSGFSDPSLLFDGAAFHLWISGGGFVPGNPNPGVRTYYFTSNDGISWQPNASNPVFRENEPGTWDSGHIETPSVIRIADEYRLYYVATPDSVHDKPDYLQLGLAISADGISWERYPGNPLMQRGNPGDWDERWIESPCVVETDSLYYLWYTGIDREWQIHVGLATSTDGMHWQKHPANAVFSPVPESPWESAGVYAPQVRIIEDSFIMLYTGLVFNETGYDFDNAKTGIAVSSDGIHWTRLHDQPVFTGSEAAWDSSGAFTLDWIETADEFFMLYVSGGLAGAAFAEEETAVPQESRSAPLEYSLLQNYPNPFNASTSIQYRIAQEDQVSIKIYDILGGQVRTLVDEKQNAGTFTEFWDGRDDRNNNLPSGLYLLRLKSGQQDMVIKLVMIR